MPSKPSKHEYFSYFKKNTKDIPKNGFRNKIN